MKKAFSGKYSIDTQRLREEQREIAGRASLEDSLDMPTLVAGFDLAFTEEKAVCAAVVLDYQTLEILEEQSTVILTTFPYIPTFLSFREMPAMIASYDKLHNKPDLLMIDGQGILHPYKAGIATHFGVILDLPTIGVAKSRLCGEERGSQVYVQGELCGEKVITKRGCNPLYISPGHKISLQTAISCVQHCVKKHKLPEPTRLADKRSKEIKREVVRKNTDL